MIQLDQKYDREQLLSFLEESFLKDFQKDIRPVGTTNQSAINKAYTLGTSPSLDLQVFEFEYSGSFNKRIALAKEAFQIMKQSATFQALAVFYSPESEDWRFSLLTANPKRNDTGNITVAYSNPRRYSFFLGPNAKVNTPTRFLIKKGTVVDFEDLKNRFSLEVVNKEFYNEIAESFTKLVGGTRGEGRNQKNFKTTLKLPSVKDQSQTNIEFAVRLIGRIIFCWFLKEKISNSGTPLMPKELLSLDAISKNADYYHKVLEPIFFEVLNKPIKSRKDLYSDQPFSFIPYLNGGLFSPHDDDFFSYNEGKQSINHNTVVIPDEWFEDFLKILEKYNFTIDENTSIDEELSIDPEMLGRIFENLLAEINPETGESVRRSTGSYYTPRVIVDYMVDESLLLYLKQFTNIDENKLRAIISYDLSDDSSYPLNNDEMVELVNAIEKVKILDPACGSGAYPIGALQKIVFILQQIDPDGRIWFQKQIQHTSPEIRRVIEREFAHKNFDYIRKLGVIRENIYGIDIQPIATEISRLRCFLTLVVDERIDDTVENRGIEPLPNLDFKFVTANSLIDLPTSNKVNQIGLFEDTEGINELREIRDMFFNASGTEREQLKLQFVQAQNKMFQRLISENRRGHADLTTMLTTWDPFSHKISLWFDPEWMFGIKNGFDIVIGNPPYGLLNKKQNQKLGHQVTELNLKYFKESPLYEPAKGGMINAFRLFVCKSMDLLKDTGNTSLIFPLAFMCDLSASNLRKFILNKHRIDYLEAFPERDNERKRVFEAVKMSVCILGASKTYNEDYNFPMRIHGDKYIDSTTKETILNSKIIKNIDPINYTIPLVNPQELELLLKIRKQSNRLEDIGKCYTGEIDLTLNKNCLSDDSSKSKLIKGAQVQKYKILDSMSQGEIVYLDEEVYKKSTDSGRAKHNKLRRIVMQGITGVNEKVRLKMTIIEPPTYCANSVNYLIPNNPEIPLELLLGILNSKVMNWCFKKLSTNSNVNGYEVDNLPILANLQQHNSNEFISLIKELLDKNDNYSYEIENRIDHLVYNFYGLTEDEIKIIER